MNNLLTDAQLKAEIKKCEYCEEKPCKDACPANCSPADFIMAATIGENFDYKRAAGLILSKNPMGGVCGVVCPDSHCMDACVHKTFDNAVNIPAVQATIMQKAKELGYLPEFHQAESGEKTVAIIGAGPAGLGAAAVLAQKGYLVSIFDKEQLAGGRCNFIPDFRLDKEVLKTDIAYLQNLGQVKFELGQTIENPENYLAKGFAAVIVSTGLDQAIMPGTPGEEHAIAWTKYLAEHKSIDVTDKTVAVIGGGAIAVDCALSAKNAKAKRVDMICLETNADMPVTANERDHLLAGDIVLITRTTVTAIIKDNDKLNFKTANVDFPQGGMFKPDMIIPNTEGLLKGYDMVIFAIGSRSTIKKSDNKNIYYAGDMINGATTVVEAVASGKNAAALLDSRLRGDNKEVKELDSADTKKSDVELAGIIKTPVSLETDFFGRKIISPFLLSAAPPSDGYEQMKAAYEAGWAGGVMKTSFDNLDVHIPAEYMFAFNQDTYANCDNVSGHPLDRVCSEIKKLVKEFPDRLTMASTGGPVSGDDDADKKVWQSNTLKLEQAGVMGIEYSLSCPQGGDGTEGDIVSQHAGLSAKIVDWVMATSDPEIPKLFKLTGAVTSIYIIVDAIKQVFEKYPNKKAGVTLANTFPSLDFRKGDKKSWEEGIVVGMSGDGVKNISYLSLAKAAPLGVHISGNGGPMDYKAAAHFLALGVKTVQFCTIAMKYGLNIVDELESGLSYLMQDRGLNSVNELIGCALPNAITDFMDLTAVKKISTVDADLCQHCGNCTRCSYQAITLNDDKVPEIDPEKCVGCSICTQKCFSEALSMRERTVEELEVLKED
jgi:NADPH-dependent glutamate synthase beta subunit-like oxidoreductase/dihydroorotate dehydrogenase/ferredoxin